MRTVVKILLLLLILTILAFLGCAHILVKYRVLDSSVCAVLAALPLGVVLGFIVVVGPLRVSIARTFGDLSRSIWLINSKVTEVIRSIVYGMLIIFPVLIFWLVAIAFVAAANCWLDETISVPHAATINKFDQGLFGSDVLTVSSWRGAGEEEIVLGADTKRIGIAPGTRILVYSKRGRFDLEWVFAIRELE